MCWCASSQELRNSQYRRRKMRKRHAVVAVSVVALLSACAVGPNYVRPDTAAPATFGSLDTATYSVETTIEQFWKQFGDETLNRLISEAMAANHDLRIALARLHEARAARGESRFDL